MDEHKTISRAELAQRANLPPEDLLSREEAAAIIGVKQTYLSNLSESGPAFYRSTTAPRGGKTWYPRADVERFAKDRAAKVKFSGRVGRLDWPPPLEAAADTPVHLVVAMIEKWKQRELYRRAQKILNDPFGGDEEFKDELRMFGEPWPQGRLEAIAECLHDADPATRRSIFKSLDDQSAYVNRKLRALCDEEGLFPSFVHPSFQVLSSLFEDAWGDVVLAERRWRALDYSGMPSRPPE